MKPNDEIQMSPCGLFCNKCSLFLVPYDKKAANEVLMWFKNENWYENDHKVEDLIQNEDYCEGCRSSEKVKSIKKHLKPYKNEPKIG